jgi:hypothetical protein
MVSVANFESMAQMAMKGLEVELRSKVEAALMAKLEKEFDEFQAQQRKEYLETCREQVKQACQQIGETQIMTQMVPHNRTLEVYQMFRFNEDEQQVKKVDQGT